MIKTKLGQHIGMARQSKEARPSYPDLYNMGVVLSCLIGKV